MNTASHAAIATSGAAAPASDAWTAFWADPEQSRCAAGAPAIWDALAKHWDTFASSLGRGTSVLDLGCGAGVVGQLLVASRSDLHVTGIDSANIPRGTHSRVALLSRISMESLPFPDKGFEAVVSQFGYEYSRIETTAREIARVLAPGARLSFLVHHADSAIVATTRARLNAIEILLGAPMRAAFCSGSTSAFGSQMTALIAKHPHDPLIAQLAQALPPRLASAQVKRTAIWAAIEEALAPERSVAQSLCARCVAPAQLTAWLAPVHRICDLTPVAVLREPNGDPVAWQIEGVRIS